MRVTRLLQLTVLIAVALALWQAFMSPLPPTFQWIFFAMLVFAVGVPHGGLDLYVQKRSDELSGKKSHVIFFLAKYCSCIFLYAVAWYVFPAMAFILFMIISCLHFGETDLTYFTSEPAGNKAIVFVYGAALLLVLLLPHITEVTAILQQLIPSYSQLPAFLLSTQMHSPVIIGFSMLALAITVVIQAVKQKTSMSVYAPLMLAVLLVCCSALPLPAAFALYFVGWHSIISLYQIGRYIQSGNTKRQNQNFVLPLLIKALPFSLLALMGLAIAGFFFIQFSLSGKVLPLVFMFLSVITLPHLQVMDELYKRLPFSK